MKILENFTKICGGGGGRGRQKSKNQQARPLSISDLRVPSEIPLFLLSKKRVLGIFVFSWCTNCIPKAQEALFNILKKDKQTADE